MKYILKEEQDSLIQYCFVIRAEGKEKSGRETPSL